ncbi:MAG: tyrosine-type recombinase/integrase [Candidatus Riflebacteria bacterium]|nr:tyrosine-type recombinase/integrase [Candidatus Riflebacteria bacterium]
METALVPLQPTAQIAEAHDLARKAIEFARLARAENTRKAYRSDWTDFESWCQSRGLVSLPAEPQTVCLYLTALAETGKKASTLRRRLASISVAHKTAEHESPVAHVAVKAVLAGILRTRGSRAQGKAAFTVQDLRTALSRLPNDIRGLRDRAILLLGFASGMRRSEIVSLQLSDVSFVSGGLSIQLRFSKTDPMGHGRTVGIVFGTQAETCPVLALRKWIEAARITEAESPIFRPVSRTGAVLGRKLDDQCVALIVKRAMKLTGLDPKAFSSHSLRVSFCTVAASSGVSDRVIALQTGHAAGSTTLHRYIRQANLLIDNASGKLGL